MISMYQKGTKINKINYVTNYQFILKRKKLSPPNGNTQVLTSETILDAAFDGFRSSFF